MENILITGASGFVGTRLSHLFLSQGKNVTGIGTSKQHLFTDQFDNFTWISADTTQPGSWQNAVQGFDLIINLAGRNIFSIWTDKYKQAIYDSRVLTTKHIVDALEKGHTQKMLSTSAIGVYGDRQDQLLDETVSPGNSFLAQVCVDWEKEALQAEQKDTTVCVMRFGVILGDGGALSKMIPAFKLFAGGPLGSGNQWFPWMHIKDLENAVQFLADNKDMDGVFNFAGPVPIRQKDFSKALGKALSRPAIMPAPAFMVKLIMGELGAAFLESQKAVPQNLLESGFSFLFEDAASALNDVIQTRNR